MSRLTELIHEIHRRSLWQVLTMYAVGSWLIWQVVGSMYEYMGLPGWVPPTTLILLLAGLPVVLATAFVQEGGPTLPGSRETPAPEVAAVEARAPGGDHGAGKAEEASETGSAENGEPTRPPAPGRRRNPSPVLTWNRVITAAVLAFAGLGLATTGFMGMRYLGIGPAATLISRGDLEANERIVLADFQGAGGGAEYAGAVRTALRADLESSPVVELLDDGAVERGLRRMEADPAAPLTPARARELAVREGLKATLEGEVSRLGTSWVITARVVAAQSGEVLAAFRATAGDEGGLIGAVDGLSRSIREKVGETLRSARASEPLEQVTTSSLEALRLYAEAEALATRQSDYYGAALLLEKALALDSTFAMAWRKLGIDLGNASSQPTRRREAIRRAFELRDRLSDRERLITEGTYYGEIGDVERSIRAYRTLLERYPADRIGNVNLASRLVTEDRFEEVLERTARALELGLDDPLLHEFRIDALWALGRRDDARAALANALGRHPGEPGIRRLELEEAANSGDYERADSLMTAFEQDLPNEGFVTTRKILYRAWIDGVQGRFSKVQDRLRFAAGKVPTNVYREALVFTLTMAAAPAHQLGRLDETRRLIDRALQWFPLDSIPVGDRPYSTLAWAYAIAGETERAREMLARWETQSGESAETLAVTPALILMWDDPEAAAEGVRVDEIRCIVCDMGEAADIIMRAGRRDSALVLYTRYIDAPEFERAGSDAFALPVALERLAQLHEERGDRQAAAQYYARFIALWDGGDRVVQPRVEAARRALARLTEERSR